MESRTFTKHLSIDPVIKYIRDLNTELLKNPFIANVVFDLDNGEKKENITTLPNELKNYLKIGNELKNEVDVKKLKEDLTSLKLSSDEPLNDFADYAAIIGASLMG